MVILNADFIWNVKHLTILEHRMIALFVSLWMHFSRVKSKSLFVNRSLTLTNFLAYFFAISSTCYNID